MKSKLTPLMCIATVLTLVAVYVASFDFFKNVQALANPPQMQEMIEIPASSREILMLVNRERTAVGVAPLIEDARLAASAQTKADDMAKNNYFGHQDKNGKQGYMYIPELAPGMCKKYGENIYWGGMGINIATAQEAVDLWMSSKPHHDAILNPEHTHTGVGVAVGNDKLYAVEHFCVAK